MDVTVLARGGGAALLGSLRDTEVWTVLRVLLVVGVIGYVVVRRFLGEKVQQRRLLILPAVLAGVGVLDLLRGTATLTGADVLFVLVTAVFAFGLGAARGATIQVFIRDGHPWQRYRPMTLVWWVALIAVRIGIGVLAHFAGATTAAGTSTLLLTLGLSLLGEGMLVAPKVRALGLPLAPSRAIR